MNSKFISYSYVYKNCSPGIKQNKIIVPLFVCMLFLRFSNFIVIAEIAEREFIITMACEILIFSVITLHIGVAFAA